MDLSRSDHFGTYQFWLKQSNACLLFVILVRIGLDDIPFGIYFLIYLNKTKNNIKMGQWLGSLAYGECPNQIESKIILNGLVQFFPWINSVGFGFNPNLPSFILLDVQFEVNFWGKTLLDYVAFLGFVCNLSPFSWKCFIWLKVCLRIFLKSDSKFW